MKTWWTGQKLCVGVLSSGIFMVLAIRQVEWARTVATLRDVDWLWVCLAIGAAVGTLVTFAFRWRLLLSRTTEISVQNTFSYIMIGYLTNILFPLRVGEIARAVLLGKRHGIKATVIFGSVVLERTLDVLTVLLVAAAVSFLMDIPPAVRAGMMIFAAAGLAAIVTLLFVARNGSCILSRIAGLSGLASSVLAGRLTVFVARFAEGLSTLRNPRELWAVLCLSAVAWGIAGTATICYIAAFNLRAPWYAGFFVLAVTNLGSAIPSSPGFIGVYHYLAVMALSVWIPDRSEALGFAIGTHGISMITHVVIGCLCLAREGIALQSIGVTDQPVQEAIVSKEKEGRSLVISRPSLTDRHL